MADGLSIIPIIRTRVPMMSTLTPIICDLIPIIRTLIRIVGNLIPIIRTFGELRSFPLRKYSSHLLLDFSVLPAPS